MLCYQLRNAIDLDTALVPEDRVADSATLSDIVA